MYNCIIRELLLGAIHLIKTEQLYYLLMIEKYQSLTVAAEQLHITQPALSISIKNLENELGFKLIKRTSHGILLTEEGKNVTTLAQKAIVYIEAIDKLAMKQSLNENLQFDFCLGEVNYTGIYQHILSYLYDLYPNCTTSMNVKGNQSYKQIFEENPNIVLIELVHEDTVLPPHIFHKTLQTSPCYIYYLSSAMFIKEDMFEITTKDCISLPFIECNAYAHQKIPTLFYENLNNYGTVKFVQHAQNENLFNFYMEQGLGCGIAPKFYEKDSTRKYKYIPIVDMPQYRLEFIYSQKANKNIIELVNSIFDTIFR